MPKPIAERIKALETENAQLLEKISRMKEHVKNNSRCIRRLKNREDNQDIEALINEVQAERLKRSEQSARDKKRAREKQAAAYRAGIEQRIEECLRMNGKIV